MIDTKTRRGIALDYWFLIALALGTIIWDSALDGDKAMLPSTYFIALALVIHAHGNRLRETLLALHTPKDS